MTKFKIKIDMGRSWIPADDPLRTYPNISFHDTAIFEWKFSGMIYIELNDKPVIETDDGYETEYLWHFFMALIEDVVPLIMDGKEDMINFLDSGYFIAFKRIGDNVLIRFGSGSRELSELPYGVKHEVTVSFDEFVEESFRIVEDFINQLMAINPKLSACDQVKKLIEARNKAKKAIEEYKQSKQT